MKLKPTNFEAVREFMVACDQEVKTTPAFPDQDTMDLRLNLIEEEFEELMWAVDNRDMVEVADALADILYVVYGMGHSFGIDLDVCFEEVQRSNMSKLVDGKAVKDQFGKVMKGSNFSEPDFSKLIPALRVWGR